MTRQEVKDYFLSLGNWSEDRFGHLIKQTEHNKYRIKFQSKSIRYEKQATIEASQYSPASKFWVRRYSAFYGQLSIVDNKLKGLYNTGLKR